MPPSQISKETPFMNQLRERMISADLSPRTINQYMCSLKRLNGNEPFRSFAFLADTAKVQAFLDTQETYNKRNYCTSIVKALSLIPNPKNVRVLKHYQDMQKELNDKAQGLGMSEKKAENMVDYKIIRDRFDHLRTKINSWTRQEIMDQLKKFNKYMSTIALGIWALDAPTRSNDLLSTFIVKSKVPTERDVDANFIVLDKGQYFLNIYKTVRTYGPRTFELNAELVDFLREMMKKHPFVEMFEKGEAVRLLVKHDLKPIISSNTFTKMINNLFNDTGKKISTNIIRSAYLTSKYGDVNKEMEQDAERMGHSVDMQKNYIAQSE